MAVKVYMSKEEIIQSINQIKRLELQKKDQRWLYLLWVGSFALIIFLNYMFPNIYPVEKRPVYDLKNGFIGLILTLFGFVFFLNAFFFKKAGIQTIIFTIICVILLYYGLPLFFNFKW